MLVYYSRAAKLSSLRTRSVEKAGSKVRGDVYDHEYAAASAAL